MDKCSNCGLTCCCQGGFCFHAWPLKFKFAVTGEQLEFSPFVREAPTNLLTPEDVKMLMKGKSNG